MCSNHVPNRGQATFMTVNWMFPHLAKQYVNSAINPFFHEDKLGEFMKEIVTSEAYAELHPIFKRHEDCFEFHPQNQLTNKKLL